MVGRVEESMPREGGKDYLEHVLNERERSKRLSSIVRESESE